ncbi:MAG: hypothetical protein QF471_01490 [Phycisphaerales bacterium]|jgi:hypothetical protein|nr:hypothetical protein [Phycisphaerales bacterium]
MCTSEAQEHRGDADRDEIDRIKHVLAGELKRIDPGTGGGLFTANGNPTAGAGRGLEAILAAAREDVEKQREDGGD